MKNRYFQVLAKIVLVILILIQLGLPILDLWKMLLLLGSCLALACCDLRLNKQRIYLSIVVVILVVAIKNFLPTASINEGHNIFLYKGEDSIIQQGLPPEIFNDWRQAFKKQYPLERYPKAHWLGLEVVTTTLYAHSSDALWQTARYSRIVNTISFRNLSEFRGGFSGELKYNFFSNDPISFARNFQTQLPFFVMYEFSEQSVGCVLYWRGTIYWQKGESFEKIVSRGNDIKRTITTEDIGKRVYALSLPKFYPGGYYEWLNSLRLTHIPSPFELAIHLKLSPKLRASYILRNLLSFLGVLVLIGLMTRINWKPYLTAISLTTLSLIIIGVFINCSHGKFLGSEYPPHGGGDDGLFHESCGRDIARNLMSGNLSKTLEGGELTYWFTPGMRYFRAVEKVFFGDTNLGHTTLISLLAWFIYLFIRHFSGFKWGLIGSILFLLLPFGDLSLIQYVQNAKMGYAEAAGFGFFMLGFYLFLRSHPRWGGRQDGLFAFTGGVCLAGSVFLRPNFAIAVVLLGLFYIFTNCKTIWAVMAGLSFALFMPLHNYLYGDQFVLIVASREMSLPITPLTYLQAGYEIICGNLNSPNVDNVVKQLLGWLLRIPHLPHPVLKFAAEIFQLIKLASLALTVYIAFSPAFFKRKTIFILAWTALAAHIPMLFVYMPRFRYGMLGWGLSIILVLVVLVKREKC